MTTATARTHAIRLLARLSFMPGATDAPASELGALDFDEAEELIADDANLSDDDRTVAIAMVQTIFESYCA